MMTTNILELGLGDITADLKKSVKSLLLRTALNNLDIRVELERLPTKVDTALDSFVSQPRYANYYAIFLDGIKVQDRLEMPRDLYAVLRGIAIGRGIKPS